MGSGTWCPSWASNGSWWAFPSDWTDPRERRLAMRVALLLPWVLRPAGRWSSSTSDSAPASPSGRGAELGGAAAGGGPRPETASPRQRCRSRVPAVVPGREMSIEVERYHPEPSGEPPGPNRGMRGLAVLGLVAVLLGGAYLGGKWLGAAAHDVIAAPDSSTVGPGLGGGLGIVAG